MIDLSSVALLAAESQRVIALRLCKLAWGGSAGVAEAYQMVAEKVTQNAHSTGRLMLGASANSIVSDYRDVVQANIRRLSA